MASLQASEGVLRDEVVLTLLGDGSAERVESGGLLGTCVGAHPIADDARDAAAADPDLGIAEEEEEEAAHLLSPPPGSSSSSKKKKRPRLSPSSSSEKQKNDGAASLLVALPPRLRRPPAGPPSASLPSSLLAEESSSKESGSDGSSSEDCGQRKRGRRRLEASSALLLPGRGQPRRRQQQQQQRASAAAAADAVVARRPRTAVAAVAAPPLLLGLRRPLSQPSRWCEALLRRLKEEEEEMKGVEVEMEEAEEAGAAAAPTVAVPFSPLTSESGALVPLADTSPAAQLLQQKQQKQHPAATAPPTPNKQQQQQRQGPLPASKQRRKRARILRDGALTLALYGPSEAFLWQTRVHHFKSAMRSLLGDRCSPVEGAWKGSVLDSVAGVFLTQNVSDFLSSKAYMQLAARWPGGARGNRIRAEWKTPSTAELLLLRGGNGGRIPSSPPAPPHLLSLLAAPSAPPEAAHACRCTDSDFEGSETDSEEEEEEEEVEVDKEQQQQLQQQQLLLSLAAAAEAAAPRQRRRLVLAPRLPVERASFYNRVPRLPVAAAAESTPEEEGSEAASPRPPPPPPPLALQQQQQRRRRRRAVPWPDDRPKVVAHPSLANSWSCAKCLGRAARPSRRLLCFCGGGSDDEREELEALRRWRDRALPAWTPLGRQRDARRRGTARPVSFSALCAALPSRPLLLLEEGGKRETEEEEVIEGSSSDDDDEGEGNEGREAAETGKKKRLKKEKNEKVSVEALDHVDWLSLSLAPLASVSDAIRCRGLNNLIAGRLQALLTWIGQVGPGTEAAADWVRRQQEGAARSAAAEAARAGAARAAALGARAAAEERIARARGGGKVVSMPLSTTLPSPLVPLLAAEETPRCCGGDSGSSPVRPSLSSDLSAPSTPVLVDDSKQKQQVQGQLGPEEAKTKEEEPDAASAAAAAAAAQGEKHHHQQQQPPPPLSPPLPPHHPHTHPLSLEWLREEPPEAARVYLLSLEGLGRKSAACVSLLSLGLRDFPVDTNVGRVCARLGWLPLESEHALEQLDEYAPEPEVHRFLHSRLAARLEVEELLELHYQMITLGKVLCSKRSPNCCACPLRSGCEYARADGARLKRERGEAARAVAAAEAAKAEEEEERGAAAIVVARRRAPALPTSAGPVCPPPVLSRPPAAPSPPVPSPPAVAATTAAAEEEEGPAAAAAAAAAPAAALAPPPPPSALALERARTAAELLGKGGESTPDGPERDANSSSPLLAAEVARLIAAGDRMQETADGACGERGNCSSSSSSAAVAGRASDLAARLADRAAAVLGFGEALAALRAASAAGEREKRSETAAALRRRYLALSSAIHPDKCPLPGADRAFAALQEAHGILAECVGPSAKGKRAGDEDDSNEDEEEDEEDEEEGDAAIPYPAGRSRALRTAFVLPDALARRLLSPALYKEHRELGDEPFLLLEMPEAARGGGGGGGEGRERGDRDDSPPSSSPPRSWRHNRLAPHFERLLEYQTVGDDENKAAGKKDEGTLEPPTAAPPFASSPVSTARCALLVPVRTAMCGRFPLHGTYFQANECFLDRSTLRAPLRVPVTALARLATSDVHFGLSVIAVCRGMRRHQIQRLFSVSRLCVRSYEPATGCPGSLPGWILPEFPSGRSGGGGGNRPKKGQAPKAARPPTALQAQLLELQAEAARAEEREREERLREEETNTAPPPPPPSSSPPAAARRGILAGFFRPARVAWHPPLALPQRGGKKAATITAEENSNYEAAAGATAAATPPPPPPPLSTSSSSCCSSSSSFLLLPAGWHPPLVLLDRRLLTPAALGIPKKHKRGGVGRWHAPLSWPPRVAAAAAAAAAAEFGNGRRVRIARYAPVSAAAKCGRCKYCLFPEMRQACTLRRAEAERQRAEEEVAALEREADAAEADAAEAAAMKQ